MNSTPTLSLAEFRATRTYCPDLGEKLNDECLAGQHGYLYLNRLFVEVVGAEWPDKAARSKGAFCTTIANTSSVSDDLASMEVELYKFACSEGYCEWPKPTEPMLVDVYEDGVRISESVPLAVVCGDDECVYMGAWEDLRHSGRARIGGGAAPTIDLIRVRDEATVLDVARELRDALKLYVRPTMKPRHLSEKEYTSSPWHVQAVAAIAKADGVLS